MDVHSPNWSQESPVKCVALPKDALARLYEDGLLALPKLVVVPRGWLVRWRPLASPFTSAVPQECVSLAGQRPIRIALGMHLN